MSIGESWFEVIWQLSGEDIWNVVWKIENNNWTMPQELLERYIDKANSLNIDSVTCCWNDNSISIMQYLHYLLFWLKPLLFLLLIYSFVLLILFCFYRYKKIEHPFKQSLKKTRLWGFIVSIIVYVIIFICFY